MNHAAEFRRCLEECDVSAIRKLWQHVAPHLHQPTTDFETLATIHRARTESVWMSIEDRAYSHRWLLDHDLPSALPDKLKPSAERLYPRVVEAVGISINFSSIVLRQAGEIVQKEIAAAVEQMYADDDTNVDRVKKRIDEVRIKETRKLLGISRT